MGWQEYLFTDFNAWLEESNGRWLISDAEGAKGYGDTIPEAFANFKNDRCAVSKVDIEDYGFKE